METLLPWGLYKTISNISYSPQWEMTLWMTQKDLLKFYVHFPQHAKAILEMALIY